MIDSARVTYIALALLIGACGSKATAAGPVGPAVSSVRVGDCGDPARDGVIGAAPELRHADRDLNGDQVDEIVVADGRLCGHEGNCHWNVFVAEEATACRRFIGTIEAIGIESLPGRGDSGFVDLRAVWQFTSEDRFLVQEYRFRRGGYQVTDALLCQQGSDDRVLCTAGR